MSNRLFLLVITACALAFSSCQKAPNRDSGNGAQGGGDEPGKITATRSSEKCELKYVTSNQDEKTKAVTRTEIIRTGEGEKSRSKISERAYKVESVRTDKIITNNLKEDGTREQISVKNYKVTMTNLGEESKLENNIYLAKNEIKTVREALDEASLFVGPNGEKLRSKTTEVKYETKYFDDEKTRRDIECKEDGKAAECDKGEYEYTSTTDEATKTTTYTEKLKAPWTDADGTTTESLERKCVTVKK